MSGEVLLVDGPGGLALRLIGALQRLTDEIPITEFALIGGLAVMSRLGRMHRATDDLDAAALRRISQAAGSSHSAVP